MNTTTPTRIAVAAKYTVRARPVRTAGAHTAVFRTPSGIFRCDARLTPRRNRRRRPISPAGRIAFTGEIVNPNGLFFEPTISVLTETTDTSVEGWLFFDADCATCTRLARLAPCLFRKRGIRITPLQSTWARRKLHAAGVAPADHLKEMRLLFRDGTLLGGGDAIIHLAGEFWCTRPLNVIARRVPLVRRCVRWLYRKAAEHRRCNERACGIDGSSHHLG